MNFVPLFNHLNYVWITFKPNFFVSSLNIIHYNLSLTLKTTLCITSEPYLYPNWLFESSFWIIQNHAKLALYLDMKHFCIMLNFIHQFSHISKITFASLLHHLWIVFESPLNRFWTTFKPNYLNHTMFHNLDLTPKTTFASLLNHIWITFESFESTFESFRIMQN